MPTLLCRPTDEIKLSSGSVNITPFRSVIDSRPMQRLRYCLQLGEAHMAYPDARGTRFSHSLDTGELTMRRARKLEEWGQITCDQRRLLWLFGFIHDIGHGPRSHLTDSLVGRDHEERGIDIVRQLSSLIDGCGVNSQELEQLMARENPLSAIVMDTPLGTDKLCYLAADSRGTGVTGMPGAPDLDDFLNHVYYLNDQLVVDSKIVELVDVLSKFYRAMYAQVYYRTSVVLSERFLQRMMSVLLGQTGDEPEITEEELVAMTDSDLDYILSHADNPVVKEQYDRYWPRTQPRPALVFVLYPDLVWTGSHSMRYLKAPESLLCCSELKKPGVLYGLEREIEEAVGLPKNAVLVAPPVPARRFLPPKINYLVDNCRIISGEEMRPEAYSAQVAEAGRFACLYVATYAEYCSALNEDSTQKIITDLVMRYA